MFFLNFYLKSLMNKPDQIKLLSPFIIGQARNNMSCHSEMKNICPEFQRPLKLTTVIFENLISSLVWAGHEKR